MARLRSCFIMFCPRFFPSPIRKQLRCGVVIHKQVRMKLERAWSIVMVREGLTTQKSLGLDRGWGKGAGQLVGPIFPSPTLQTKTVPCSHLQVLAYVVPPTWKLQQGCPGAVCFQALPLPPQGHIPVPQFLYLLNGGQQHFSYREAVATWLIKRPPYAFAPKDRCKASLRDSTLWLKKVLWWGAWGREAACNIPSTTISMTSCDPHLPL